MNRFAQHQDGNLRRTRSASLVSMPNQANSLTPITAHYSLNTTLKKAFYKLRDGCQYSTALAVGMQFCRIALWDIPQHGYYDSPKYDNLKAQNAEDVVLIADLTVIEILPQVLSYAQLNKTKAKFSMSDLEVKLQEAKMLREEAHKNAKLVISERSKIASNNRYNQGVGGISKIRMAEEIDHNLDSSPSWANACGACGTLMCVGAKDIVWPTTNPLNEVKGNNVEEHSDYIGYFKENVHTATADKKMIPTSSISEGYKAQYQHARVKFERSTSAPPILWQKKTQNDRFTLIKRQIPTVEEEDFPPCSSSLSIVDDDQHSVEDTNKGQVSEQVQFQSDLDRALYLSSLELQRYSRQESSTSLSQSSQSKLSYDSNSEIASKALKYQYDFHKMSEDQKIQVEFLNTYQGRIQESTNGCTVIAPLMAIQYLCNLESLKIRNPVLLKLDGNYSHDPDNPAEDGSNDTSKSFDDIGINDDIIAAVIDIQAPLVVPKVRKHLGLHRDALIVPSDAHDYLINDNFLHQHQFVGVHGGNILDSDHLGTFLRDFSEYGIDDEDWKGKNDGDIKKVAATIYFHEHVVCIHRLTTTSSGNSALLHGNTTKPPKKILFRKIRGIGKKSLRKKQKEISTRSGAEVVVFDVIDSLPSARTLSNQKRKNDSSGWLQQAARIRCIGEKSLHTYLMWYACSKFSQEDKMFIDSYQFDANKVDLDPRVFQTFIWSE